MKTVKEIQILESFATTSELVNFVEVTVITLENGTKRYTGVLNNVTVGFASDYNGLGNLLIANGIIDALVY